MTKVCSSCGLRKTRNSFHKSKRTNDGRSYKCKQCANEFSSKWRKTRRGIAKAAITRRRLKESGYWKNKIYSIKERFNRARNRAKAVGKVWSISFRLYKELLKKKCYYCISEIKQKFGYGLDRIDNSKGYEPKNVLPCCSECNRIRSDKYTVFEMKTIFGPAVKALRALKNHVTHSDTAPVSKEQKKVEPQ